MYDKLTLLLLRPMRLCKIKLSGFKSFVDPTTLTVPGQVVGIVGPNGCGKSNIIDAVTWVMGESSAKHLRGDSLTDVIFNGSTNRQPVSQASVELIFDNSEKKITGEFASYNEISIKRQINREAVSTYFLNGSRCRRRDITGLFLGTGLGPRGYSIIEQGMISRMIEAKPEELRVFIEEAAGISKYRERRRETENRIRHSKENIARLSDIQEELEKQLSHLHRQAKAAERYQLLKVDERRFQAELLVLNWQELNEKNKKEQSLIVESENKVEQAIAELRQTETAIETRRTELSDANEHFNQQQSVFYQVGADISQVEQNIKHTNERIEASKRDLQEAQNQSTELQQQAVNDKQQLAQLATEITSLEPKLLGSRSESDKAYEGLNLAEQAMQSWQTEWDTYHQQSADCLQTLEVSRARKEYLEGAREEQQYRLQKLTAEYDDIDPGKIEQELAEKKQAIQLAETGLENEQQSLQRLHLEHESLLQQQHELTERLTTQREEKQTLSARLESLKALQESAYGDNNSEKTSWLQTHQLQSAPRLAQRLECDTEWSDALEVVLSDHLQAICIDDLQQVGPNLTQLESGTLELIETSESADPAESSTWASLAEKIHAPLSIRNLVVNVWLAEDLSAALSMRTQLQQHHSIVTKNGVLLGKDWMRVVKHTDQDDSLIAREQEIQSLQQQQQALQSVLEELENERQKLKENIDNKNIEIKELQGKVQAKNSSVSEQKGQLSATETQLQQLAERAEQLREQLDELDRNQTRDQDELQRLQGTVTDTETLSVDMESQKSDLEQQRERFRESLSSARSIWQKTHEESHGIALQLEAMSSQKASLQQAIKRNELQMEHVSRRQQELDKLLTESNQPLAEMQTQLDAKLADKITAEKQLSDARTAMQDIETDIRKLDEQRQQAEQTVSARREQLEKTRLSSHETKVRLQAIEDQFEASEQTLSDVTSAMPDEATQDEWQRQLESIARKIQRLGAINLAAIDEHAQLSERKEYLDNQRADLNQALETLETAIRKIDQETKARFKETFDNLNNNLKEIFPQIFGGGSAYLELTSQDLLETGISVMARPPGKRNTTIHLLSGGEKALTAVALVFSIFKLNPAPFCILDEVDAPLDDANAGRFSELVKSMSDDVQFIVITHNKITMEIAQQLLGVTMHEPGVSRLVTVDVDAAVEMAASA